VRTSVVRSSFGSNGTWRTLFALVILIIATLWRLWPAVDTTPFHRDEARWIGNSSLLREWRHPLGPRWQDEGYRNLFGTIDESNRRRSQPPLAMYVLGLGMLVQGQGLPTTGYWIMTEDTEWNAAQGNLPSDAHVRAARRTNVALALLTVVAIYFIAQRLINRVAGFVAALAYAVHPLVLSTSTRAWSDPLLVLCLVLAIGATIRFGHRPSLGRATLVGILLGLGAATKLSPLLLAAAIGGVGLAWVGLTLVRRHEHRSGGLNAGIGLLWIPVSAYVTFLSVYPYLWTAPISHTRRMLDFRSLSFGLQARVSPQAKVDNLPDAMRRIGSILSDRYSVGGFVREQLVRHLGIGDYSTLTELDLTIAVGGWLLLVWLLFRRHFEPATALPLMVLAGQVCLIAVAFRLDYSRYLLPIVPAVAIGIGAVAGIGWELAANTARNGVRPHLSEVNLMNAPAGGSADA
jgi:4-amino-4-deoxy-L-arabinose transferase-like glycosyltransferase